MCLFCWCGVSFCCFFFKQKTAYEMRISDWSSDVCSSDLVHSQRRAGRDIPSPLGGHHDQLEAVWDLEDAIFNCYARHSGDSPLKQEPTKAGERWNIWTPSPLRNTKRTPPAGLAQQLDLLARRQSGRESCRERGSPYVSHSVVAVSLKKKTTKTIISRHTFFID